MSNKESRGKGRPEAYKREMLLEKLRAIAVDNPNQIWNYSKLEEASKGCGEPIPRRAWNKVKEEIGIINRGVSGINPDTISEFPLPSIEEAFDLWYGKSKTKLMDYFKSYNSLLSSMWNKAVEYDRLKDKFESDLAEKDREIKYLKETISELKKTIIFYENKYYQVCAESTYSDMRKELGIEKNVLQLKPKDKDKLSIDFIKKQFAESLKD